MVLRTSSEASRMTVAVDLALPCRRCWRRRRTMFSMSMMASSTTTPTAITNPAKTIVLMVTPCRYSTRAPAISDYGMATTLSSAAPTSTRKAPSHLTQAHALGVVTLEGYLRQVLRLDDGQDVAESEPLIRGIDEPLGLQLGVFGIGQGRKLQRFGDRLLDVIESQVVHTQPIRIDQHRQQLDPLAPDRHVRHARHLHQAELDRPVGHHRKIYEVVLF